MGRGARTVFFWEDINVNPLQKDTEVSMNGMSFWGLSASSKVYVRPINEADEAARFHVWNAYESSGTIDSSIKAKPSSEQNNDYVINYNSLTDYMYTEVAKFVNGRTQLTDANWNTFCNNQVLRGCNKNTGYLQVIYNALGQ